ncbi:Low-density lipoprotein (LDL) receptor class A repeat-containing protein [Strongyloides ratti]|uniref:Low-density lipoprotein (LDL) receptor class A repeat-containing protein n=1 Tax=Strongyloides ratti TaxID=34506 RepID=A0A090LB29_STRRB|nr:Low-density lipoprotein (LDL) receptor class A repeat-containing protein [Strongyloides ratti]CEF67001.1 Low-density lipoprotein (LDL) receptor class A repeat-containing protein [Strongyloides ratti]
MFYIANNLLLLAWCIEATNQFKFKFHHVLLDDALEINDLVNNKYTKNYHEINFNISINPFMYNGILMNLKSDLDLHQTSCETFEHILILVTNQKNITIGCTTYMTHFFQSPLHLTFLLPAYEALKEFISLTFTPLRFSCSEYHSFLKQCPNNPKNCIPKHLFCDGKDNCGLNGDEQNCYYVNDDIPLEVSIINNMPFNTPYLLYGFIFLIIIITIIILLFITYCIRKKYITKQKNGYCKGIFGNKKRRQTSSEPEETVALLTLGLKGFFPQAVPNHIESIHDSINKIATKNTGGNYQNIKQIKR